MSYPTRVLAKAVMDLVVSLDLADDDDISEDDAVKLTEWATGDLRIGLDNASEEDRQDLIRIFREIAAEEGDLERREAFLDFPEAAGLVPEE